MDSYNKGHLGGSLVETEQQNMSNQQIHSTNSFKLLETKLKIIALVWFSYFILNTTWSENCYTNVCYFFLFFFFTAASHHNQLHPVRVTNLLPSCGISTLIIFWSIQPQSQCCEVTVQPHWMAVTLLHYIATCEESFKTSHAPKSWCLAASNDAAVTLSRIRI